MILYHGTDIDFASIDLKKCKPNKDFGQGFYLTDIQKQAKQMAVRRCDFEQCGVPVIQKYEFDERLFSSNELNVKRFEKLARSGLNSFSKTEIAGESSVIIMILYMDLLPMMV